jgi:hypothetical protein
MDDDFVRIEISEPGAAIREIKIQLPRYLKEAISESLDRGKKAAEEEKKERRPQPATAG